MENININHTTKAPYSGNNADTLNHAKAVNRFTSYEWLTFVQARTCGLQIKNGSKGTKLMKVVEDKKDKTKTYIKKFTVFNLDQTQPREE